MLNISMRVERRVTYWVLKLGFDKTPYPTPYPPSYRGVKGALQLLINRYG